MVFSLNPIRGCSLLLPILLKERFFKMNKASFTDSKIKQLMPRQKRYSLTVDTGLSIRVMPSGVKSWVVRIPYNNRVSDITLGHFPEIGKRQACQLVVQSINTLSIK